MTYESGKSMSSSKTSTKKLVIAQTKQAIHNLSRQRWGGILLYRLSSPYSYATQFQEKPFPAENMGEKSWGRQVPLHSPANMQKAAVILSSTADIFNQGYMHCLTFSFLGNDPQRKKQGLWPDKSLANLCEGQKTYVPNYFDISASHIFYAVMSQNHLPQL